LSGKEFGHCYNAPKNQTLVANTVALVGIENVWHPEVPGGHMRQKDYPVLGEALGCYFRENKSGCVDYLWP
jgi:hypothetical protein